jgi:RimJ/RimL family protein N-acetyltransferase
VTNDKGLIINSYLKLRAWAEEDKAELQRIANNSNVARFLRDAFPHPYTKNDAERWITLNIMGLHETHFCIEADGKPAGGIGIVIQNDIHKYSAELAYWLGEEYWGRGIITRCIKTVTPYFMDKFELKRMFATAFTSNSASVNALEKSGYVCEGVMKKYAFKNGVDIDGTLYAFTK